MFVVFICWTQIKQAEKDKTSQTQYCEADTFTYLWTVFKWPTLFLMFNNVLIELCMEEYLDNQPFSGAFVMFILGMGLSFVQASTPTVNVYIILCIFSTKMSDLINILQFVAFSTVFNSTEQCLPPRTESFNE